MNDENLKVSVLYGAGVEQPMLPAILKEISQVELVTEAAGPEGFLTQDPGAAPDSILVYLDGEKTLPAWMEDLTQKLPRTVILVCSASKEPEFLIKAMQLGVREFLPLPLAKEDLSAALDRVRSTRRRLEPVSTSKGQVVVVTAHKGGAGATSIAINLAAALSEQGSTPVALVDLGRPFPDIGNFLDRESPHSMYDLLQNLADLDRDFMRKIVKTGDDNLAVLHGISDFHHQDSLDLVALEKIFTILRSLYAWVVVDLSHWLDELFLQVLRSADLALLLTELSVPDLRNLSHLWPTLRDWPDIHSKIRVVVNRHTKGSPVGVRNLQKLIKSQVFHLLPSDYSSLIEAINQGVTLGKVAPRAKLWLSLQELAQRLARELLNEEDAPAASRSWRRLLPLGKEK